MTRADRLEADAAWAHLHRVVMEGGFGRPEVAAAWVAARAAERRWQEGRLIAPVVGQRGVVTRAGQRHLPTPVQT